MVESYKGQHFFKNAFDIFSNRFLTVLLSTIVVYVPYYILYIVISNYFSANITGSINYLGVLEVPYVNLFNNALSFFLNLIFTPIFVASMYILVKKSKENAVIRPKDVILEAIKMTPRLFTASFVYNLIISVPYIIILLLSSIVYFLSLKATSGVLFNVFELGLNLMLRFLTICTIAITPFLMTLFYFNTYVVASGTVGVKNVMKKSYSIIRKGWFSSFLIIMAISLLNIIINEIFFNLVTIFAMPDNLFMYVIYNVLVSVISGYFFIFLSIWYDNKAKNYIAK